MNQLKDLNRLRLFLEILVVMVLAELVVEQLRPLLAPGISGLPEALLDASLLTLLAGPFLFWRMRRLDVGTREAGKLSQVQTESSAKGVRTELWTLLSLLIGFTLSLGAAYYAHQQIAKEARDRFEQQVDRLEQDIYRRFDRPMHGLRGLAGFFKASKFVDRQEFSDYWEARDIPRDFPGVQGFSYIQEVARQDLPRFMAAEKKDQQPDFSVKAQGNVSELFVVRLIEPAASNRATLGLDLGSEALRRAAVLQALQTGQPILSDTLTLIQEDKSRPGFLFLLALPTIGTDQGKSVPGKHAPRGLVAAVIVLEEILAPAVSMTQGLTEFQLFDGTPTSPDKLLFDSRKLGSPGVSPGSSSRFELSRELKIGGHAMTLRAIGTPAFEASVDSSRPILIGAGGTLLTLLASLAFWLLSRGQELAEEKNRLLSANMTRLARIAEHTSNAVVIADENLLIEWVNEAFTRISGFSQEEAIGKKVSSLRDSATQDPQTLARIHDALSHGERIRVQTHNRAPDGREYWLDADIQPMRNEQGQFSGYVAVETDITREKEASARLQIALQDNEALMMTIHTHTIVSETNAAGQITNINQAFIDISGYSREELIGQDYRLLHSGLQSSAFWRDMWNIISAGKPWRGQICNRAKNGRIYWVDSLIAPFSDLSGQILKYVSIETDITVAKKAEAELRQERQRLEDIILGTHIGTWELDLLSGEQRIDKSGAAMLGYRPEDLKSIDHGMLTTLIHPEDVKQFEEKKKLHIDGVTPLFEIESRMRHKNGHWIWLLTRGKVSKRTEDGRPAWMSGFQMDISQRKLTQLYLVSATAQLKAVLDSASEVAIIATGRDQRIMVFNRGAEIMLGYNAGEVIGQHTRALYHDPVQMETRSAELSLQLGRPVLDVESFIADPVLGKPQEWTLVRKGGEHFPASEVFTALKDPDGSLLGYLSIGHDITRQKEYEKSLREARAMAEQATEAKGQFLANMSHEIRTPMNAILGMLRLLHNTALTPRQLEYTSKTEGAARSLLGLLNDILDFSKVDADKMTLDPHPFRLDRLMRDLSVILSSNVGTKEIEVLFDIDPQIPEVLLGDALRIQQVLINLGGNAVKFTAHGQVVVHVRLKQRQEQRVTLEFAVQDSGIGIASENQIKIFSGFSQAEASTTRRFGGTGLGLAISKRLIELMGGHLTLESQVGQGSIFSFSLQLPIAQDSDTSLPASLAPQDVLVIDDNPLARTLMQQMLHALDWQVDVAANSIEALEQISARIKEHRASYQVIFVDSQMPELDGGQTSRRIRHLYQQAVQPCPLIVLVAAQGREMQAQHSHEDPSIFDAFLVKPVTASMLCEAVVQAQTPNARISPASLRLQLQPLAGMHLLVVEDNPINQQVAQELLSAQGASVTLADNGQLGIQAIQAASPPFDAVLMDMQMPVMDGLTAIGVIRNDLQLSRLPVIAMTANAMSSDRDACLAAGMNDHISKPFDLDKLVDTLVHHTGWTAATLSIGTLTEPVTAAADVLPQEGKTPAALDLAGALQRMGGDLFLYLKVLNAFIRDNAATPRELQAHLSRGEQEGAVRVLHTLKGLAQTVGASQLHAFAQQAEAAVKLGPLPDAVTRLVEQTQAAINATSLAVAHLMAQLQNAIPRENPGLQSQPQNGLAPDGFVDQLQTLQALLQQSDMQSMEVHAQLSEAFEDVLGDALGPLAQAMASLDFEAAAQQCAQLLERFKG